MTDQEAKKPRVLVVEDDSFMAQILVENFKKSNFDFDHAPDGEQALKKISSSHFDIILLDLMLPGINGYEVLAEVKKDPQLAKIPVVIFSNMGKKEDIEKGLQLGAARFLIKSQVFIEELIEKVKEVLHEPAK